MLEDTIKECGYSSVPVSESCFKRFLIASTLSSKVKFLYSSLSEKVSNALFTAIISSILSSEMSSYTSIIKSEDLLAPSSA